MHDDEHPRGASENLVLERGPADELRPLLAMVSRGDRAAFKTVYGKTSARLFGVVKRIVKNRASAEEVLQDAYLRIWQRASRYDPSVGAPLPWLTTIARNCAIDAIRQRGERLAALNHDGGEDLLMQMAAPPQLQLAERDELKRCLAQLDDEQCRCLLLAYYDGYSREELALRFDRPVNTVKTWLHRGLISLRTCLESE